MKEITSLTNHEFELIKITLRLLDKFSNFDSLKIYESDSYFLIHTVCVSDKYFTKTKINKFSWRVIECIYHKAGEQELILK